MNASTWLRPRLLLLSCAIALGIGALVVVQLMESRSAIWQRAQAANTNLLFTVSHVLERTFEQADRGLQHSVAVLERSAAELGSAADAAAVLQHVRGQNFELLFAAVPENGYGIQVVLDADGRVIATSRAPPEGEWVFSDRPYFRVHQKRDDAGFYIGAPFVSTYDGLPSLAMSRRWNRADGSFGGTVVQTMKLSVLQALFGTVELGSDSGISVFLRDGTVVTRFPYTFDHIGVSVAGTPEFERFLREGQGSFTGVPAMGGVESLNVFRSLDRYPLIVNVAQATHGIFGGWVTSAAWLGAATLVLMAACLFLAIMAEHGMRGHRRTAALLSQAERELRTIVDSLPVMVAYWDHGLMNRMANIAHKYWIGLSPEQLLGRHVSEVVDDDDYHFLMPYLETALAGKAQLFERDLNDVNGAQRHAIFNLIPDWDKGRVKGLFVLVTDISLRKAAETALFEEKERFRVILESIKDGVITADRRGDVLYLNPAAEAMTGWRLEDARGLPMEEVMQIEPALEGTTGISPLREALELRRPNKSKVEHVLVNRNGERMHIENSAAPILDEQGMLRAAVVVFHDSGPARAMANRMMHLAQHDALTGLPNRRRLDLVGQQALLRARAAGQRLAVLYLDLDGFKQVNDEYGHAVGDELLVAVTRRLSTRLRTSDSLYRQGGDEFVVLMERMAAEEEAKQLSHRLIETCQAPVSVAGKRFTVTLSIGIGLYPDDATELGELIQWADRGMYEAKNAGRNRYARMAQHSCANEAAPDFQDS